VAFKNIRAAANPLRVELKGFDQSHAVEDVTFDDVMVNGQPLNSADVKTNAFVKKLELRP
jgi:hypothetical protein